MLLLTITSGNVVAAEEDTGPFVLLMGAPGSGKTTNGNYISEKYNVPNIEVRKILQDQIALASEAVSPKGSRKPGGRRSSAWNERNKNIKAAMKKLQNGELVDDDDINFAVLARVLEDDCRNGFVLDGYPGSVKQAEFLDGVVAARGMELPKMILLDIPDQVALERMKERGRADDKSGFAEARLEQFRTHIGPILEYFMDDGLYIIDASQDLASIQAEIDRILDQ